MFNRQIQLENENWTFHSYWHVIRLSTIPCTIKSLDGLNAVLPPLAEVFITMFVCLFFFCLIQPSICWRRCWNWTPTSVSTPRKRLRTRIWPSMPTPATSRHRLPTISLSRTWTFPSKSGKVGLALSSRFITFGIRLPSFFSSRSEQRPSSLPPTSISNLQ